MNHHQHHLHHHHHLVLLLLLFVSSCLLLLPWHLPLVAEAKNSISSRITVMGIVYCDICSNNTFSKHSYFLPGDTMPLTYSNPLVHISFFIESHTAKVRSFSMSSEAFRSRQASHELGDVSVFHDVYCCYCMLTAFWVKSWYWLKSFGLSLIYETCRRGGEDRMQVQSRLSEDYRGGDVLCEEKHQQIWSLQAWHTCHWWDWVRSGLSHRFLLQSKPHVEFFLLMQRPRLQHHIWWDCNQVKKSQSLHLQPQCPQLPSLKEGQEPVRTLEIF